MSRAALLLLGCASCLAGWAQQPQAPSETRPRAETPAGEASREPDTAREGREERSREDQRRARRTPRSFTVTWEAPQPLRGLFEKHLIPPQAESGQAPGVGRRAWIREARRRIPEIAATEGYFSPVVDIEAESENRDCKSVRNSFHVVRLRLLTAGGFDVADDVRAERRRMECATRGPAAVDSCQARG